MKNQVFCAAYRLVIGALIILPLGLSSCAHKPQKSDASGDSASANSKVSDRDISLDAQGSDSGKIDGLKTVHFDFNKANLTQEARQILATDAKWMMAHNSDAITIEGHCDRFGSIEYNLALGERRAKRVQEYLVDIGVPASRLTVVSYGKEKMLDTSDTTEADARNRRANFVPVVSTGRKALR